MVKKLYLSILLVVIVAVLLVGCSSGDVSEEVPQGENPAVSGPAEGPTQEELILTLDELSEYNGKNGMPAYVAVDGVIYDVTNVKEWPGGEHNGFAAGNDLTEEIKNVSPHGISKLDGLPVVGKLAE